MYEKGIGGNKFSANAVALSDFLNPPKIEEINVMNYTGAPGEIIRVRAWDDFKVASVSITIMRDNIIIEKGKAQPRFRVVSKGWMKASHRELNTQLSTEYAPWYAHTKVEPLEPGKPYMFEVPVMPTANLFKKGSRIRLELANGDSSITDFVFEHLYLPNKIGKDTIFHSAAQPSQILLPVQRAE